VLGRGGFGTVFVAVPEPADAASGRVAIKLARSDQPGAAFRLTREIEALRAVGPPHVPALIGAGELGPGAPYIVMELVDAPPLSVQLTSRVLPMPPAQACTLTERMLRALEAIHERGFVHRDLKPENVLVRDNGVVILDFGLVRRAGPISDEKPLAVRSLQVLGTVEYMAPEQCEGRPDVDARADIYAVGVMLYEMLSGHPPFWGPPAAVREGHLSRRPPRLPSADAGAIRPELEEIVLRCLEKDPRDRFQSAAALRAAIAGLRAPVLHAHPSSSPETSSSPPIAPRDAPSNERRTVSLLHFASPLDPIALRGRIEALGGHMMRAAGGRYVVAFGHEAEENPARLSLRAAQDLLYRGICERVWLDLATVSVTVRPDGSKRLVSALVASADRSPTPEGPAGILLSPAARAVLSDADLAAARTPGAVTAVADGPLLLGEDPMTRLSETGPLVGREDLLDALALCALRSVHERTPSVTAVIGEAGHGKSHLRRLLVERLRGIMNEGVVISLRAREPIAGGGDSVRDLLEEALELSPSLPERERIPALRERLGGSRSAEAEAALALALGWVSPPRGDEPVGFPELRALEAAPGALQAVLTVAGGEALRRRAAKQPLCVVLDDAQYADEATLSILEHAALAEASAPIFVCALGRPAFREARPAWGERAAYREMHDMGPLDPQSAASLCRALLSPAENVPESAVRRLVGRTQGIPLLLVELIRGLKGEGIVRRNPNGKGFYLATDELDRVPDLPLIEWLARREIAALAPAERAHAGLVATVGAEVTLAEVDGVLRRLDRTGEGDDFPLDARIGIERLLAAGVLRRQRHGRIGFRHALMREAIARSVSEPLRRRIHLASVEYYRDGHGTHDEHRLAQLAHHAAQAGLSEAAGQAYLELAEAARARHAYLDAERFYSLALAEEPGPGKLRREAHRGRGLMRYRLARHDDALVDFSAARAAASADGDVIEEAEILLDEATVLDWMGDFVASDERVEQARVRSSSKKTPALTARLALGEGRSHYRFSRVEEAVAALERAASEAAALGEDGYETQVIALLQLGFLEQGLARLDDATRAIERAVTLCESHGDALHLAGSINSLGLLHACRGDAEKMRADFERVISLGRELGQDTLELIGHYNLGECLYLMDRIDEAVPHVTRVLAIDAKRPGSVWHLSIALLLARIQLYRDGEGDCTAARDAAQRIRAQAAGPLAVPPAEEVFCAMIELATNPDTSDTAWDELEARSARYSIGQERIEVAETRGLWSLRRGRPDEAERRFQQAIALAARIPNAMGARLARRLAEARRA
jgi:predicted ATPase